MAGDIFAKQTQYRASNIVTSDEMTLKIGGGADQLAQGEFLVQNFAMQYNQPLNRLFEIGTSFVYFAPGRSIGTCQIGRIVGRRAITAILGTAGQGIWTADICKGDAASRTLIFMRRQGVGPEVAFKCDKGINIVYELTGCVVESYGLATDANGLLVQENVSIQFAGLKVDVQDPGPSEPTFFAG